MLRSSRVILFTFAVILVVCPVIASDATSQERVSFTLHGTVTNTAGEGVKGARVVMIGGKKIKSTSRNTRTDSNGKWTFPHVKNGQWKIQAFSREAISEIYHITISWGKNRHTLMPIHLKLRITSREVLAEGKSHLYNHQWEAAGKAFDFYCHNFPSSRMCDEALFWNAFTCFKRARTAKNEPGATPPALRERSLRLISHLLEKFPSGLWAQDARILRLDIWNDQFRSGTRSDLKPVMQAADPTIEPVVQVRRAAIEIMISIKPGFAWNALQREFAHMEEAKLRQNFLVLFSRFEPEKAATALKDIAAKDPDPLVRAGAKYWLRRVDRRRNGNPAGEP